MRAQDLNFAPKLPKMEDFQPQILYFWNTIFGQQKKKIPTG